MRRGSFVDFRLVELVSDATCLEPVFFFGALLVCLLVEPWRFSDYIPCL
jgi:hypothetical protein